MISMTIGYGQPIFDYSRRHASHVSVNVIPNTMVDNMPESPNSSRPRPAPAMHVRLAEINRLEPEMEDRSDDELRRKTDELKERLRADKLAIGGL
jgi:hypothetical protein